MIGGLAPWEEYQEETRRFFSSLGLDAQANHAVQGVRAIHAADVYVTFFRFGIQHRWIVECKCWKRSISKDKVLTLQSIVLDTGVDKGFLLSEEGFQSGALKAAVATNITLTSLVALKAKAEDELRDITLEGRLSTVESLFVELRGMTWRKRYRQGSRDGGLVCYAPPGYFEIVGRLSVIEQSLKSARRGEWPVGLDLDAEDGQRTTCVLPELLNYADALFVRVKRYINENQDFEPQSDE